MATSNIAGWDRIAETHESTTPLDFASYLDSLPNDASILEVGCGYGRVLDYLQHAGFNDVQGIDASERMVQRCNEVGHHRVRLGVADSIPFDDKTFDGVLCIATLSSISDKSVRDRAAAEMFRILKPGGICFLRDFCITLHGRRALRYVYYKLEGKHFGNFVSSEGIEFHHFTAREVNKLLLRAGFSTPVIRTERFITMHNNKSNGFTATARKV